jgi:hypothetical protein
MTMSMLLSLYRTSAFGIVGKPFCVRHASSLSPSILRLRRSVHQFYSTTNDGAVDSASAANVATATAPDVSLYRAQGLCCVYKPRDWTSNDVVSYIRKMLERDATHRGAKPSRVGSRKNKSMIVRVGHGGTLDPLATGVLVIGVGSGTKQLQRYVCWCTYDSLVFA